MENKTHYRKVFKSDHLSVADLEDFIEDKKKLVFTIKIVKQEINVSVAGRKGNHNIAYFVEPIKPLVLNAGNSKIMKDFNNSPFVEDWKDTKVELYIENNVRFGKDVTSGVRIRQVQPKKTKTQINEKNFNNCVTWMKGDGTWEKLNDVYSISSELKTKLEKALNETS